MDGVDELLKGVPQWAIDAAGKPCHAQPGSETKMAVLEARFALGLDLWNPEDTWSADPLAETSGGDSDYLDDDWD